jgi:hypothetical protein
MLNVFLKILWGIASILVIILVILTLIFVGINNTIKSVPLSIFGFISMASYPIILVVDIIHIYKSKRVSKEQKNLWAALIFFGNILVFPVYWYLYVWREPKQSSAIKESLNH